MKKISVIVIALFLFSCVDNKKQVDKTNKKIERKISKLEQLMLLPKDTILDYYNLSNDSISTFPNLSSYTIKSLNLSHNQLDNILIDYLPKGIVKFDVSYNKLSGVLRLIQDEIEKKNIDVPAQMKLYKQETFKELNVSHNNLKGVNIAFSLRKLIVSYNDITYMNFNQGSIEYIDISNNSHLSNIVVFDPNKVDTIIRNNITNDKKLIYSVRLIKQPTIDCFNVNDK